MSDGKLKMIDAPPSNGPSINGDPDVQLTCVSNLFMRSMHFKHAGDIEKGHAHIFDHVSLLTAGSAKITVEGVSRIFTAPHAIFIKKDWMHEIEAMEDNTILICVHALRDGERVEDIIDPDSYVIPPGMEGVAAAIKNSDVINPMNNINKMMF
jgi:quercetin dioxygenase-like cupin family protein